MKKIMIDMDDVICGGGFLKLVNDFLGTNYAEKDLKTYYIQDLIPKERMEEWKIFFQNKNVYAYTFLLPDAYRVMEKLSQKYELYIVTAYIFRDEPEKSADNLKNKFNYLIKELPFIKPEQYIFTTNKSIVQCDIKIDDRPSNLQGNAEMKLMFDAYHNREISDLELEKDGIIRVNGWKHIEEILL
ncbi:MAG: hypothetical protein ACI4VQ_01940 [Clostridia bacterium]